MSLSRKLIASALAACFSFVLPVSRSSALASASRIEPWRTARGGTEIPPEVLSRRFIGTHIVPTEMPQHQILAPGDYVVPLFLSRTEGKLNPPAFGIAPGSWVKWSENAYYRVVVNRADRSSGELHLRILHQPKRLSGSTRVGSIPAPIPLPGTIPVTPAAIIGLLLILFLVIGHELIDVRVQDRNDSRDKDPCRKRVFRTSVPNHPGFCYGPTRNQSDVHTSLYELTVLKKLGGAPLTVSGGRKSEAVFAITPGAERTSPGGTGAVEYDGIVIGTSTLIDAKCWDSRKMRPYSNGKPHFLRDKMWGELSRQATGTNGTRVKHLVWVVPDAELASGWETILRGYLDQWKKRIPTIPEDLRFEVITVPDPSCKAP